MTTPPLPASRATRVYGAELSVHDSGEDKFFALAARIRTNPSDLIRAREEYEALPLNALGIQLRGLSPSEIAVLEKVNFCRCNDWTNITVAQEFDPFKCIGVHFIGKCTLGVFCNTKELLPGLKMNCGILHCTLANCQVGDNCLLENVRFAANVIFEHDCVIFDVGNISCSSTSDISCFGCGVELTVGLESGGRELLSWPELTLEDAALIIKERRYREGQQAVRDAVGEYVKKISSNHSWVKAGARISHVVEVKDCYVGPGAKIENARSLNNVCILSNLQEPTIVSEGSSVSDSILQWGVHVCGSAIVKKSVLLEHSSVEDHGVVCDSIISPNSGVAKGEVSASLLGPFVGFHHQSLLISAFWPEGKGNVAYGGMLGSNHTGRAPDQEIWPGEGNFFGLGCSIRFPADYSTAPYSMFAAGVQTLPQKITFPFSLVHKSESPVEGVPPAFNEIIPGWTLHSNPYGIVRAEIKFAKRDKARRHQFEYKVFRPAIMEMVLSALRILQSVEPQRNHIYVETNIPGLGKNFMREKSRKDAIEAYTTALKRYALRIALGHAESGTDTIPDSDALSARLLTIFLPSTTFAQQMDELIRIESENAEKVFTSKATDDDRGRKIIPGYEHAHVCAENDPVVKAARDRATSTKERVRILLAAAHSSK